MNADFLNQALQVVTDMMLAESGVFIQFGIQLYRTFAIIIIAWIGIKFALSGNISMEHFAKSMLVISFGLAMTKFYADPIPGIGYSFYEIFTKQGEFLALKLNENMLTQIKNKLGWIWDQVQNPSINILLAPFDLIRWGVVCLLILLCYLAVTWVVVYGYIALAICVLLGPIFIPFFIVPQMEWMFWSWVRSILQYSFYPVVANAVVYVAGTLLVRYVDNAATDFTAMKFAAITPATFIVLGTFAFVVMKIPSLVNSLFSGKGGETAVIPIPALGMK